MTTGVTGSVRTKSYRIGDLADEVGVTPRTIRYYEELGLLGVPEDRSKGRHRVYTDADVDRLRELVRLRELLGISLDRLTEIADDVRVQLYLRDRWASTTDDSERRRILEAAIPIRERQLELVRARQRNLADFEAELSDKLADMRGKLGILQH